MEKSTLAGLRKFMIPNSESRANSIWAHMCQRSTLSAANSLDQVFSSEASDHGICIAEGPHIFKRNGFYYLITAEGGTELEHQEWIFRSESPMGPYAPAPPGINPVIYNRMHQEVRQTGHMDLVDDRQGNTWAVFLGVRPQCDPKTGEFFASQLGRETFLAKANWTDEGWLVVNGGFPVGLHGINVADGINWRDDFHNGASASPLKPT
jgi:beta-xylosidase